MLVSYDCLGSSVSTNLRCVKFSGFQSTAKEGILVSLSPLSLDSLRQTYPLTSYPSTLKDQPVKSSSELECRWKSMNASKRLEKVNLYSHFTQDHSKTSWVISRSRRVCYTRQNSNSEC